MKANIPLLLLFLAASTSSPVLAQFPNFPAADLVLGAADFVTPGTRAKTPSGIDAPAGIAVDPLTGKVFVSASNQNRILRFASAASLANGANAEAVLGQINFSSFSFATTQSTLNNPRGLFIDTRGRLWVADFANNRVLMFEGAATLSNGAPADRVLGQSDFTTSTSATSNLKMKFPVSVFVDGDDNLWVADQNNHRVLKFAAVSTLANGAAASVVLGQPDFNTGTSGTTISKMNVPAGISVDPAGSLWVADQFNHRILRFDNAATLASGASASGVLGQTDFDSGSSGTSAQKMNSPGGVVADVNGTAYVLEFNNRRVLLFRNAASKSDGAAADGVIGQSDFTSNAQGLSSRKIKDPLIGIALDTGGRLWIADTGNHRVLRFSPDRTKPILTITSRAPRTTAKSSLSLSGKATDASGIASVRFRVGNAAFRNANGTTSWKATARLRKGRNSIQLVATDTVGNVSTTKRVRVARR